jgi:ribosomal protein L37AE/L43A
MRNVHQPPRKRLTTIAQLPKTNSEELYNMEVKVVHLGPPDQTGTYFCRDITFGDMTGSVKSRLWKSKMESFETGKSYLLENVRIDHYDNKPQLKFTLESNISQLKKNVHTDQQMVKRTTTIDIVSAKLDKMYTCARCAEAVLDSEISEVSFYCKTCKRKSRNTMYLKTTEKLEFTILNAKNEEEELTMTTNVLPEDIRKLSASQIEDWLIEGQKSFTTHGELPFKLTKPADMDDDDATESANPDDAGTSSKLGDSKNNFRSYSKYFQHRYFPCVISIHRMM